MIERRSKPTGSKAMKPSPRKTIIVSESDPYSRVEAAEVAIGRQIDRGDFDRFMPDPAVPIGWSTGKPEETIPVSEPDPYSRAEASDAERFERVARSDYDHLFMDD